MRRDQLYAGVVAPLIGFFGMGTAAYINRSWWSVTDNAISDLGKVGLPYNWVLNVSLVLTALLGVYYTAGLFPLLKNSVEKAGIAVFSLGLVFLALIGLFPEGTSPHYTVSWGFFIFGSIGYLTAGLGIWLEGNRGIGILTVSLFIVEVALAKWAFDAFPGVAIAELVGALAIVVWHYAALFTIFFKKWPNGREVQGRGFTRATARNR